MPDINFIFLSNIPNGISADELKTALKDLIPDAFLIPFENDLLQVTIFVTERESKRDSKKQLTTTAVVSGFQFQFEKLLKLAVGKKIGGKDLVIKKDKGDPRDSSGRFITKLSAESCRKDDILFGLSHRKVFAIFTPAFWSDINLQLIKGANQLFVNTSDVNIDEIQKPGRLKMWKKLKDSTILKYHTALDSIQAISYLNLNPKISTANIAAHFADINGTEKSRCNYKSGLGTNGTLIDLNEAEKINGGIIPFQCFRKDILNPKIFCNDFHSLCWRCELAFTLLGTEPNLYFVAGTCGCNYNSKLDVLDKEKAYFWPGETFTRLVPAPHSTTSTNLEKGFVIMHFPMRESYSCTKEYQDTVLPILQAEWQHVSRGFKEANFCEGNVSSFRLLEVTYNGEVAQNVYAVKVVVSKTKFWNPENFVSIKKVTLTMEVIKKDTKFTDSFKGNVWDIENEGEEQICIYLQVSTPVDIILCDEKSISIFPKPDKTEYEGTKHLIRTWAKKSSEMNPLMKIILNNHSYDWTIDKTLLTKIIRIQTQARLSKMWRTLNSEQMKALKQAMNNAMSVIQGPPGTGKTYTALAIALTLSVIEKGAIVICTPSNVASDGIGAMITTVGEKYELNKRVLRIFSKTRERQLLKKKGGFTAPFPYACLHEEVKKIINEKKTNEIASILKKLEEGDGYLLTQKEKEKYKLYIRKIELKVMMDFDIFITTIGALSDKRVESWNERRCISSVIVDELGQLTQPSTLAAFCLNPSRVTFIGDHMQLKPTIKSFSASTAGLDRSLMEWIALSNQKHPVPWVTLLQQHRMVADIRSVVSAVTYDNKLEDAPLISSRKHDLPLEIYENFPQFKTHSIVVYHQNEAETLVGTSYANEGQACKALVVVNKLLQSGVPGEKITILSLYEAQTELIKYKLISLGLGAKDVGVFNVDGFQGKENSITILSFVRSNNDGLVGFTSVGNRLNVAISRAKFFLIIICNYDMLANHKKKIWMTFTKELQRTAVIERNR